MSNELSDRLLVATLSKQRDELLHELQCAHQIIKNALNIMTTDQQVACGDMNARDGVDGEGVTRSHERGALIARSTRTQ
ncbi:hypothetical protein WI87_29845 [Burkholderia ubonensis]|uniref:hypothetical protein n=1 Tax=Burkholderia ubonensis TaxID=101571 RepID=UPI000759E405|nr:hypothetical protein [Burkholderia ubonensis]KVD66870.1 hypothetical protein WI87_29845 [Burkholderia ubonensis]